MKITPLSDALGVEVTGIDLTQPQDPGTIEALRTAFSEGLVMVVRDQHDLSAEDQVRFCEFFGPLGARSRPAADRPETADMPAEVMFVSNRKEDGKYTGSLPEGEMEFHMDQCYEEAPARATCLYAIAIPDSGGDTLFGNLCAAYEALPDDLRAIADGHQARHVFSYGSTSTDQVDTAANTRSHAQPMVVAQPETGRKSLYVNRLMTREVVGLDGDQGHDVLARLFDHQERPEFVYAHKWRKGDLVIWDNLCTVHARTDFDKTQDRHLRRFTVAGKALVAG
ncbi:MAG: TauD/TfdA family dioxygenase [Alphaproteobacteria bacterium]|nr:TauD/TfdA family dioxygenase [Alphaproteobacteria bacterium]